MINKPKPSAAQIEFTENVAKKVLRSADPNCTDPPVLTASEAALVADTPLDVFLLYVDGNRGPEAIGALVTVDDGTQYRNLRFASGMHFYTVAAVNSWRDRMFGGSNF